MYSLARRGAETVPFPSSRKTNKMLAPKECIALAKARWFGAQPGRLLFLFSCAGKQLPPAGFCFFFSFAGKQNVKTLLDR
jgi:hypothetical protein